ncbi:hypothetical protein ACHAPO_007225 [Fusarium lateritium]
MAKLLIDSGADVNIQDGVSTTPLYRAVCNDLLPLVDVLLEAGADQDIPDNEGVSPLGMSLRGALYGDFAMTRRLLERGGNLATVAAVHELGVYSDSLRSLRELLKLGLDPFSINLPGRETTLTCILSSNNQNFALNRDFDFYRLAEEEPSFLRSVFIGSFDGSTVYKEVGQMKAIIKRIPWECRARVVNFEPDNGLNIGFTAILPDMDDTFRLLLEAGFDIERERRGKGSALMFASSVGAFKCFKMLIRYGAKISYLGIGKRGEPVVRSAVEEAKRYPKLLRWLLVERYYETKCLAEKEHNGPDTVVKPWSGPRKAAYTMRGDDDEFPRMDSESMTRYARRAAMIRQSLRGLVLPVTLVE